MVYDMRREIVWRYFFGVICALSCYSPLWAQLPQNFETCAPFSTFAQEIKNLDEPMARIVVDQVKFDGPTHISALIRQKAVRTLTHRDFGNDSDFESGWLEKLVDVWHDQGYFEAEATAKQELLQHGSTTTHVRMIVHIDEGQQFRLSSIQFRSSDPGEPLAFLPEPLRSSVALSDGDIFSGTKIRQSIDALKRLYASHGYIDMVTTPLTDVDFARQRISVVMEIDQQTQFRVASVEVHGLEPGMDALLRSRLKHGQIYDASAVDDFLKQNASSLPSYLTPQSIQLHRNVTNGTVDFRLSIVQDCLYDD